MTTKTRPTVVKNAMLAAATGRMIESLEGRKLLSVSMIDGVVNVTGTDGVDHVQIFATHAGAEPMLTVQLWSGGQGTVSNFRLADVTGVSVDGLAGNDRLFVDHSYDAGLAVPVTLFGGAGDDVLIGGAGVDELVGGTGSDWIDDGTGGWLESSDEWVAGENAAPLSDAAHQVDGEDSVADAGAGDHVEGGGADHMTPPASHELVEAPAGAVAGLFGSDAVDAEVWGL